MQVEKVAIASLVYDPANARKHDTKNLEAIKGSLARFGQQKVIVVDKDNVVVAGNGTLQAAKELGWTEIEIHRTKLTGTDRAAFAIADNRSQDLSTFDDDILSKTLESLKLDGFDLSLIGFDDDDLAQWVKTPEVVPGCDEDEVPEVKETRCKPGDLWQLGNHRLLCGDSTNVQHIERLMGGEKADMVFTDPPYELETKGGGILKESSAMKGIRQLGIDKFDPSTLVRQADTMVFCCNKPLIPAYITLAEKWDVAWDLCVYHKQNVTPNYGGHLMTDLEYLLVVGKQAPNTGIGEDKSLYSKLYSGGKDPDNETAWSKPVALCEKFIKLYSINKSKVLDLFLGSGSTLIACEKTNRRCFGLEIDPHYCSVILARWEKFTGQQAVLLPTE